MKKGPGGDVVVVYAVMGLNREELYRWACFDTMGPLFQSRRTSETDVKIRRAKENVQHAGCTLYYETNTINNTL